MRTRTPFIAAAALAALVVPSTVEAHGGSPNVFTEVVRDEITIPFEGCSGEVEGWVTLDFRDTFHVTEFADEHFSVTGNNQGTFDYVPFVGEPSSGRYRSGFHTTFAAETYTTQDVFVGVGVDADGVRTNFIVRNHLTGSNGEIRVEYHVGCD